MELLDSERLITVKAWILQGYDQALMNGLLTLPSFYHQFPAINTSTPELDDKNATLQGSNIHIK